MKRSSVKSKGRAFGCWRLKVQGSRIKDKEEKGKREGRKEEGRQRM